jgi:hypothetical protein
VKGIHASNTDDIVPRDTCVSSIQLKMAIFHEVNLAPT